MEHHDFSLAAGKSGSGLGFPSSPGYHVTSFRAEFDVRL